MKRIAEHMKVTLSCGTVKDVYPFIDQIYEFKIGFGMDCTCRACRKSGVSPKIAAVEEIE